jgi:hypothetical protein
MYKIHIRIAAMLFCFWKVLYPVSTEVRSLMSVADLKYYVKNLPQFYIAVFLMCFFPREKTVCLQKPILYGKLFQKLKYFIHYILTM